MAVDFVDTPLMKQYVEMKKKHPDAIMLFRVGDFYETFSEDAITTSKVLGLKLTRRANGSAQYVELAGFPHHALDTYLPRLIRNGYRVAICEQLEDPKLAKKLVKRGITELVTPGVAINDNVLNYRENNFLAAVYMGRHGYGVSFLDISTGEFLAAEGNADYIEKLLANFSPKEVLVEKGKNTAFQERFSQHYLTFEMEDWVFTEKSATERLTRHFQTSNLKGFGIQTMTYAITAAGAILHYLDFTKHTQVWHITSLRRVDEDSYVRLDRFTIRNLEIVSSMSEEGKSLLDIIDKTLTPMGARMLRRWMMFPLKTVKEIDERLNVVDYLFSDKELRDTLDEVLRTTGDMERLISKVAVGRVTPRELVQLRQSLATIPIVKRGCADSKCEELRRIADRMNECSEIADRLERELEPDAPSIIGKGGIFRSGVNATLDELRSLTTSNRDYLTRMQQNEIERTGIQSLKIGYNNVYGYYMEVRNTYKDKVPQEWVRKQTLTGAERYITQELKEYEEKILGAEQRIISIEQEMFADLVKSVTQYIPAILANANELAKIDCLLCFNHVATEYNYSRPQIDDSLEISIRDGRHPVIERQLPLGETYVANSIEMSNDNDQIFIITGPNMAGKSALLRQTALIVLMAQMGCYVPAFSARIGVVDKIFTRVGASDNLSGGESTFMVEMNEAASILNNISERSLILFDELGRGTSTYDGISIAWAIVEYLHECKQHPKTLFATHYHELNEMEKNFRRIANFNVSVSEQDGKVIFLRKLMKGGSRHSFGIHVAQLAGMPPSIVKRAEVVLKQLEQNNSSDTIERNLEEVASSRSGMQLSFFQLDDPVLSEVRKQILDLKIDNLTPIEALNKLNDIRTILTGHSK